METEEGLAAGAGLHGKELTSCFRGRFPHPEMGHTGNSTPRHMLEEGAFGRALFRQPHPYLQMDLGALGGPKEWACSVYCRRMSLSSLVLPTSPCEDATRGPHPRPQSDP